MSEILKDRSIVLRTYDYGETSLVVSFLTRSHGKIRLLAKGAKKNKSPFAGSLRTGSLGNIVFYFKQERGLHLLKEIENSGIFQNSIEDLEKLCIFQAGLEVLDRSVKERDADELIFDLFEGFIRLLPRIADSWVVLFALYARLLKLTGFYPATDRCAGCGTDLVHGFMAQPQAGRITCVACGVDGALFVSERSARLLSMLMLDDMSGIEELSIQPDERKEIGRFLHFFFLYHIDGYRLPNALQILKEVD
ncbi:MAG: DNA repair protein RecO [Candidatus Krumholzibacteria bacterium]|nr:DNA repair protein RecO [Candidatus Krumholzibacteria bacterium]